MVQSVSQCSEELFIPCYCRFACVGRVWAKWLQSPKFKPHDLMIQAPQALTFTLSPPWHWLGSCLMSCHVSHLRWVWFPPRAGCGEGPCLALNRLPMMSFNLSMLSACAIDVSASPLNPDLVGMPASLTFSSLESLYIIATVPFATLNSLTRDDSDSCNSPTLISTDLKLRGILSICTS